MKQKKGLIVLLACACCLLWMGCGEEKLLEAKTRVEQLHNGDAKFYQDQVVTSVGGVLCRYDLDGNLLEEYPEVASNWLDSLEEERVIVYGNMNQQVGIVRLDEDNHLLSDQVILETENLLIDPTILKVKDWYYITVTEIIGTVNNSDPAVENGVYTIKLYRSEDLENWEFVSDVATAQQNLEDVDIFYEQNRFCVSYEKEVVDRGDSAICLVMSEDPDGTVWGREKVLLQADCDHEPAAYEKTDDGWILYYSSDKEDRGASYMGGDLYYATFDETFQLKKEDQPIRKATEDGVLLYDVKRMDGKQYFLMTGNYMTESNFLIEVRDVEN